ncbi:MAG TPA: VOC family protein, partial [Ilumatobacteraceae bacterium]
MDANDPLRLAQFWAEALRWRVESKGADEVVLVPTDGTSFDILFEPVPEKKEGANRLHLDLTTTSIEDQQETVARLIEVDARHIDIGQRPEEGHVVLADPEGNEFCIIAPGNSFLAGCERLGSITCDGT